MNKEKITMENLHSKLQGCCYIAVGDYPTISQGSIKIVQNLLEQIKEEILERNSFHESEDYFFEFVSLENINEVFNKYLTEKGGK